MIATNDYREARLSQFAFCKPRVLSFRRHAGGTKNLTRRARQRHRHRRGCTRTR